MADTGVGIAPEDQATVFEEFRQVGAAAKKVEGTGLGLAISRKFVELHGGTIRVDSEVGQGLDVHVHAAAELTEGERNAAPAPVRVRFRATATPFAAGITSRFRSTACRR